MNKLIIGVFGSDLHLQQLHQDFVDKQMDPEHMHVITAPTPVPDMPDQTRFIAEAEESARGSLAKLSIPSESMPHYIRSLRDGGSIFAVEVADDGARHVAEMMQKAGSAHVAVFDTTTPVEMVVHEAAEAVEDTSESMLNRMEKIWDDVKASMQKVLD